MALDSIALQSPWTVPVSEEPILLHRQPHELNTLSVLMPVYNERLTLQAALERTLTSPVEMEMEVVVVDDGSTDGSWDLILQAASRDSRIRAYRHDRNRGKGAAIRTAIGHMSGDIAIIQDADLEYNPHEYPTLLQPLLECKADAVFGSRFVGHPRRVLFFWHAIANRLLTLACNMVNDLNLTDMETCYKAVRTDVLKYLMLNANTFTIEPELTTRLAQWGARIFEVPISYQGRTYDEGKKIRARDGMKAMVQLLWTRFVETRFTAHSGFYTLTSVAGANRYNQWLFEKARPFLGKRLVEAGAGIGNMSKLFLSRERLILVDREPLYLARLRQRFGHLANVRVLRGDLAVDADIEQWSEEEIDTIFCSNVLEHLEFDVDVLRRFENALQPGGMCIVIVPASPGIYSQLDRNLGHYRRYTAADLRKKMNQVGLNVVHCEEFNRLGWLGWACSGLLFGRQHLSPKQMILFDQVLGLAKVAERILPVPGMSLLAVGQKRTK